MSDGSGRLFVITGGPGSGKTTLIRALAGDGFLTSVEAGRAIIQDQLAAEGEALPWSNQAAFADLMFSWELRSYRRALRHRDRVFFDRGIPDVIGYLRLVSRPVRPAMERAAARYRYDRRVFIAPPWPEIFEQDAERKQTFDEAVRTHDMMHDTYSRHGYDVIALPLAPVADRVRFIMQTLAIEPPRLRS